LWRRMSRLTAEVLTVLLGGNTVRQRVEGTKAVFQLEVSALEDDV